MPEHEVEIYISTDRGHHTALVYAQCSCGWESAHFSKTPLAHQARHDHLKNASSQDAQSESPSHKS